MTENESIEYFIESLWILSKGGILIFEENYVDFRNEGVSTDLISSFLAAIVSFSDEAFADEIQHIQFSNRKIVFKFSEYVLFIVAISDKARVPDIRIKRIIEKIAQSFYNRFEKVFGGDSWPNDIRKFQVFSDDLKQIVKKEPLKDKILQFFDVDLKDSYKKVEKFITKQAEILTNYKKRLDKYLEEKKSQKKVKKLDE